LFSYTFDLLCIHIDSPYKRYAHKELSTSLPFFLEPYLRCSIKKEEFLFISHSQFLILNSSI